MTGTPLDSFIRRRPPRRPEAAPPPAPGPQVSLTAAFGAAPTLAGPAAAEPPARRVPQVRGVGYLNARTPMLSLDRFQSAIGSMQVSLTGDVAWVDALWELDDLRQGSIDNAPLDLGRRRLVSHDKMPGFVLGLRHSESLRRALFYVPRVSSVTVNLYGGTTVVCDPSITVLALYQHAGEITLRYDSEPYPTLGEVRAAYGFA